MRLPWLPFVLLLTGSCNRSEESRARTDDGSPPKALPSVSGDAQAPPPGEPATPSSPPTEVIPEALAAKVAGCWTLGPDYRADFVRVGSGMTAKLRLKDRFGKDVALESVVRYLPRGDVLGFKGIPSRHPSIVTLQATESGLRASFSIEREGKWSEGLWQDLKRCAP